MSVVKIVHWKNVVGRENLDSFLDVQRAVLEKHKMGHDNQQIAQDVSKKIGKDLYEMFTDKRRQMRYCGHFVDDDGKGFMTGWFEPVFQGKEIKFRFAARAEPDSVSYVSWDAFHADRDVYFPDEERIRPVCGLVKQTTRQVADF